LNGSPANVIYKRIAKHTELHDNEKQDAKADHNL